MEETSDRDAGRIRDCIHEPSIRGYRVLDERNILVEASARKAYHVTLQRRAYGLRSSWGLVFAASPTSRVCAGFSEIRYSGADNTVPVRIATIRQLSPEEEEYLLIQFGLKEPEVERMPVPQEVKGADVEELDPDANE